MPPDDDLARSISRNAEAGELFARAYGALRSLGFGNASLNGLALEHASAAELSAAADLLTRLARSESVGRLRPATASRRSDRPEVPALDGVDCGRPGARTALLGIFSSIRTSIALDDGRNLAATFFAALAVASLATVLSSLRARWLFLHGYETRLLRPRRNPRRGRGKDSDRSRPFHNM